MNIKLCIQTAFQIKDWDKKECKVSSYISKLLNLSHLGIFSGYLPTQGHIDIFRAQCYCSQNWEGGGGDHFPFVWIQMDKQLPSDLCGESFAESPPVLFGENVRNQMSLEINCAAIRRSCLFGTVWWLYLGVKFLISKEFVRGYGSFVRLFSYCLLKNSGKDKTAPGWWEGGGWWPAMGVRSHEQAPPVMTAWWVSWGALVLETVYQADALSWNAAGHACKTVLSFVWFCRNLEGLCDEWWHSGCSGDLTTPDHSPSQRAVFRQSGWEQSRILARKEHGARPSPGLQHDGAEEAGVHDPAESRKAFLWPWAPCLLPFLQLVCSVVFFKSPFIWTQELVPYVCICMAVEELSLVQVIRQNKWKSFNIIKDRRCLFLLFILSLLFQEGCIYIGTI